jgi:ELWxxDGT repeat protein
MVEFRGRLFFNAADAAHGMELWMSDGTHGGTRLFKDIAPGSASSYPSQMIVAGDGLFFVANDQVHGEELWTARSLNPARTSLVKDFVQGSNSSYSRPVAALHDELYFTLHPADQFSDLELWRTDGSMSGTVLVKRFSSPNPTYVEFWSWPGLAVGNRVYVVIQPLSTMGPGAGNAQLWITDGTSSGTTYLTEPLTYGDEGPIPELFAVEQTLLFGALDNVPIGEPAQHGRELWRSQGTASSTRLLQDLQPGPEWGDPSSFARAGSYVYFLALDASRTYRLWALPVESVRCSSPPLG